MIDNIQISIRNVYVRYEDTISCRNLGAFTVGVLLKELIINTPLKGSSDKKEKLKPLSIISKLISIKDLSVYMDYPNQPKDFGRNSSPFLIFNATSDSSNRNYSE